MNTAEAVTTHICRLLWPGGLRRSPAIRRATFSWLALAGAAVLLGGPALHAQDRAGLAPQVTWRNGRLAVRAESVPLAEVLQKIAHVTGLQLVDAEKARGPVTASFADVTLRDALEKLLVEWDYAYAEGTPGIRNSAGKLIILEPSLAGQRSAAAAAAGPAVIATKPRPSPVGQQEDGAIDPSDQAKKMEALHAAATKGDKNALTQAIADPDPDVQKEAFDQLTVLDAPAATNALVAATQNEEPNIAIQSLALLMQSEADHDVILNALGADVDSKDLAVKTYAVQSLTEFGPEASDYLEQAYTDPDASVRLAVVQGVARKEWGVALLTEAVNDADEQVRSMAERLLQQVAPQALQQQQQQQQQANQPPQGDQPSEPDPE